jgi:hypothetical protein
MRTSVWKSGLLAVLAVAGLGFENRAEAKRDANLDVCFDPGDSNLECGNTIVSCFDVSADKNITHIFVDVNFDVCQEDPPFQVTVDGEEITRFHTRGGPCNHFNGNGQIDIERSVWFPLPRNQKEAEVCVYTDGVIVPVSVGAKAANECAVDENEVYDCTVCDNNECPWD